MVPSSSAEGAARRLAPVLLRDPRDAPLLAHLLRGSLLLPVALANLVLPALLPGSRLPLTLLYVLVLGWSLERFITMFHDANHHRLFKAPWGWLDLYLRWIYGPVHGSTPVSYHAHHVMMHHPTDNMWDDLSSTLPYRRDSIADFLRYYVRFFFCMPSLASWLSRRYPRGRRKGLVLVVGELSWWVLAALAAWWDPLSAALVFAFPLVVTRTLLIMGNWGEHAFVDPEAPDDLWRSSTDLHGETLNDRVFNVGHHIAHHIRPGAHFSTLPAWFQEHIDDFGRNDAMVLRDLHYPHLCLLLLAGRYDSLAERFVQLPGAPVRSRDQVIALMRARVVPIPRPGDS